MSQVETTSPPAPEPPAAELEQFISRGIDAQKAVDDLLARMFADVGLKPTPGQLARFTAQLAEAERSEQRANELLGEVNRLRANAKSLRKSAPKILRETPQPDLPWHGMPSEKPLENGDREPTAADLEEEKVDHFERGLEPEPEPESPPANVPPAIAMGATYTVEELALSASSLDVMVASSAIHPNGFEAAPEACASFESVIHKPIELQGVMFAVVKASRSSERWTWTLQEVIGICNARGDVAGWRDYENWGLRRGQMSKMAPQDVPLNGVRALEVDGSWWWRFASDKSRITLWTPAPTREPIGDDDDESPDGAGREHPDQPGRPIQTPAKPPGQTMTWHQWAQSIRHMKQAEGLEVAPAGDWLELYNQGLKPTIALAEYLHDREAEKQDKEDGVRAKTIARLKDMGEEDLIKLMDDPNVNDNGVYVRDVAIYPIQTPKGTSAEIRVARSSVDGLYRASHDLHHGTGGSSSAPSIHDTGYSGREYAVRTEAQAILRQFENQAKRSDNSKAGAERIKGAIAAVEKFIKSNAHAQVRSDAGEEPARDEPRPFDGHFLKLDPEVVTSLNCCGHVAICGPNKKPPQIKAQLIGERLWAVTGAGWHGDGTTSASLTGLLAPADFEHEYPGQLRDPKAAASNYHGITVQVLHVGQMVMTRERQEIVWKAQPKPKAATKVKGVVDFRPQTIGQWFATFRSVLDSSMPPGSAMVAKIDDPAVVEMFESKMRPSDAARKFKAEWAQRATGTKKGAKKR